MSTTGEYPQEPGVGFCAALPGPATLAGVNAELDRLVRDGRGVVARRAALAELPEHLWSYALRTGQLVTAFPGVAVAAELAADPDTRRRAALVCAGTGAALSHTTALAVWGMPVAADGDVHVLTGTGRRLRVPGIVAHRRAGFVAEPPQVVFRRGLPVTRLERSLVDSWPLAVADAQRAPLLHAIAERTTTPDRITRTLREAPRLPGLDGLRALVEKIATGCRSELELWGYDRVFTGPGMPPLQWQVPVSIGARSVYLDVFDPQTRTNFELDGAKYHACLADRERDLRRDAALAALGILVVRFTHDRLVDEPEQVRQEILAILAMRRRQLAAGMAPA